MNGATPQTKSEIRSLLRAAGFRPRRRRGQSFLIDGNLMRTVVDAAQLTSQDLVFEVGTGTGSLTRLLADAAGAVISVEIEPVLARVAVQTLHDAGNVTLIQGDILDGKNRLNPEVLRQLEASAEKWPTVKLVANLPYVIATPLVMNVTFQEIAFERMVFTVQREVADRLTAKPGTRQYGWVSVVAAAAGEAKILRHLPASAFWPEPRVSSSLVLIHPREDWKKGLDVKGFRTFGMFVFQQRRKTVLRILRDHVRRLGAEIDPAELLERCGISPKTRGDQLKPEEVLLLSQSLT